MDDRTRGFIATGCNSEGRPCGKCPRVTVKTEHSYLRLRPQGKLKEVRGMRDREERKKTEGQALCLFFRPLTSRHLKLVSHLQVVFCLFLLTWTHPNTAAAHFLFHLFLWSWPLPPCFISWISVFLSHTHFLQLLKQYLVSSPYFFFHTWCMKKNSIQITVKRNIWS